MQSHKGARRHTDRQARQRQGALRAPRVTGSRCQWPAACVHPGAATPAGCWTAPTTGCSQSCRHDVGGAGASSWMAVAWLLALHVCWTKLQLVWGAVNQTSILSSHGQQHGSAGDCRQGEHCSLEAVPPSPKRDSLVFKLQVVLQGKREQHAHGCWSPDGTAWRLHARHLPLQALGLFTSRQTDGISASHHGNGMLDQLSRSPHQTSVVQQQIAVQPQPGAIHGAKEDAVGTCPCHNQRARQLQSHGMRG